VWRFVSDIQSLANLLRQCEDANKSPELTTADTGMSLYQEFCDHLDQLESKKKLLIKPDFMMNGQDKEKLSDSKAETECSTKKSLIEVISEDSEKQTSKQTEGNDPRDISDHCGKDVSDDKHYVFTKLHRCTSEKGFFTGISSSINIFLFSLTFPDCLREIVREDNRRL